MKSRLLSALFAAIAFAGCSTPLYYGPKRDIGGWEVDRLAADSFRVNFRASSYAADKIVDDYALLKAADTAQEYGFRYFSVVNQQDIGRTTEVDQWANSYATGTYGPTGGMTSSTQSYNQTASVYRPGSSLKIICFKNPPSANHPGTVYDAKEVSERLRTRYRIAG
ncbi:MAG: hypothetical protein J0I10_01770 [Verrucomicrobia bacterium]|nr:hypothetical protein [Verrucomicrobiota bacterium]